MSNICTPNSSSSDVAVLQDILVELKRLTDMVSLSIMRSEPHPRSLFNGSERSFFSLPITVQQLILRDQADWEKNAKKTPSGQTYNGTISTNMDGASRRIHYRLSWGPKDLLLASGIASTMLSQ